MSTAQASLLRVPLAEGTLVATNDLPPKELIPSLLATSDVLGTGWFAADAANVKPGSRLWSWAMAQSDFSECFQLSRWEQSESLR